MQSINEARLQADAFLHAHADEMLNGSYSTVIESAIIHVMQHTSVSRESARRAVAHSTGELESRTNKAYVDMSSSTSYSICLVVNGHRIFLTAGTIANRTL